MIQEIFNLYRETLPDIIRNECTVKKILSDESNHVICVRDNDKLIGVSVVKDNVVYLLCVDKGFQRRGIGMQLLRQSEEHIASNGFTKVIIGAGNEYIMPGIPMNKGAHNFFAKRGYTHAWGDEGCFDMSQSLATFEYSESIGDTINSITYRWAKLSDLDNVLKCVADAEESFVQYYRDKQLYEQGGNISVLVAEKDGEILGTLHVGMNVEAEGLGSVGCTATMHKHRGQGIAGTLVKLGTKHLKNAGLEKAFLGYTYTYILNIYGRAGYKISMGYFMGEKTL